jgi:hypothetical protein
MQLLSDLTFGGWAGCFTMDETAWPTERSIPSILSSNNVQRNTTHIYSRVMVLGFRKLVGLFRLALDRS